jgi:hypothetical protein
MMTTNSQPQDNGQPDSAGGPGDVPAARPASLDRLDVLLGRWQLDVTFEAGRFGPESPAVTDRGGQTTFEWMDGRYFLIQHFTNEHPAAPNGMTIIGLGADPETFVQHYYDSRGVMRNYQMTLRDNVWTLWRESPGFWQRFRGVISDDGNTITGAWEFSPDGQEWQHDFRVIYTTKLAAG